MGLSEKKNLKANFQCPPFLLQLFGRQNNCFGQLVTAWNGLGEAESWLHQSMVGWDEPCVQCRFELVELQIIFVGSCWCSEMQITDKICSTMFCLSLDFCVHGLVFWWFLHVHLLKACKVSINFFIGCFFFWFIWHGRVPTQDVHSQTSSMISTNLFQLFLVPETRNDALN